MLDSDESRGYTSGIPMHLCSGLFYISVDGELGINKVIFLRTRASDKDCGSLVSSGPKGFIHIWNVFNGGVLRAKWKGVS